MSERRGLVFHAYFPRTQPSSDWYEALLLQLWERGMAYNLALNWEAKLQQRSRCWVDRGRYDLKEVHTLAAFIEQMPAAPYGYLEAHNGVSSINVAFSLEHRPYFPAGQRLSWITLETEKYYALPPDRLPESQGLEYLHTYQAFWEWCATLCTLINALYGFDYSIWHWQGVWDESPDILLAQQEAERVLAGELPDIAALVQPMPIQYLPPALATADHLLACLEKPGTAVRRLLNGGALIVPEPLPFTYQAGVAHEHLARHHQKRGHAILRVLRAEREGAAPP